MLMTAATFGALLALAVGGVAAQEYDIYIHFEGFGYEEGGFDYSAPGDEIHLITRITGIDDPNETLPPDFPFDPVANEYTLVVTALISNGEIDHGVYSEIVYNGGLLEIYEDASMNSDWGTNPDVNNPPASFFDGDLWLSGPFDEFSMILFRDAGQASFNGMLGFTGGSAIDYFQEDAYTFGGVLWPPHNPGIPEGYDISLDGEVWAGTTAVEASTLSHIKSLY